VLIIEDVVTAETAVRQSIELLRAIAAIEIVAALRARDIAGAPVLDDAAFARIAAYRAEYGARDADALT
jgi:orotate phosphoribosyltransferase